MIIDEYHGLSTSRRLYDAAFKVQLMTGLIDIALNKSSYQESRTE
jgi:hypothetical protein